MLSAFIAGLLLITFLELGDKAFFIAVVLAMRHPRQPIYAGVTAALALMTILSIVVGQALSLLAQRYAHYAAISLFVGFGARMLYEASRMPISCDNEVAQEAVAVAEQAFKLPKQHGLTIVLKAFWLTFLAEWGDLSQFGTVALATSTNAVELAAGAICGHGICTALAVTNGRVSAGRLSERQLTFFRGCLFLCLGVFVFRH